MFVTAFPLGPALMYLSTVMRVRIDGWKFCQIFRRPEPRMAEDIGVWLTVLDTISNISAVYVYALVFFTSSYLVDAKLSERWLYFLLVEHFTLFIKYVAATLIEDVPPDVTAQLDR
jgi:anoctamin-10/anoctamin-7